MANLNQVLREEIGRLARRETKAPLSQLHKNVVRLKRDLAALKKELAGLQKESKRVKGLVAKSAPAVTESAESAKVRLTGKRIVRMRAKMRLSQADFGKLAGLSTPTVAKLEKVAGKLKLRDATRAALATLIGIGAREAKARLAEMGGKEAAPAKAKKTPAKAAKTGKKRGRPRKIRAPKSEKAEPKAAAEEKAAEKAAQA